MILIISGCSEDLEIMQDYPSVPVVYAVINPHDSVHYVRVQKTFKINFKEDWSDLNSDSLQYEGVEVYMYGMEKNSIKWVEQFHPTSVIKDYGFFPTEGSIVFELDHGFPINWSTESNFDYYSYPDIDSLILEVKIPDLGITTRAATTILVANGIINWKSRNILYLYGSYPSLFGIPATGEPGASSGSPVYKQIDIRVHFREVFQNSEIIKEVKWSANKGWDGNGYPMSPERFYNPLRERLITTDSLLCRKLDSVDVTVLKTSDFFNDYWVIKEMWDEYDRPPYSNFDNSYGMFISIARGTLTGLQLNWQAADSLYESEKYRDMKFVIE